MSAVDPLRIVANLTHELKTPLHAILSTASILNSEIDGSLTKEQKKQVEIVIRNGEHLLEMITSLLSYSSTLTSSRELKIFPIDLDKTLNNVYQELKPIAQSRGITLTYTYNSSIKPLYTDKELLLRIFLNILSNALKFTKASGTVDVYVENISPEKISIRVADSGVGMSQDAKDNIFNAFYQADSSSTREFGGVGLGLSLVKVACDQIEASIKVESELEQGSIFTIEIPNLVNKFVKKKLAIVGVDELLKSSINLSLEDEGYDIVFISDLSAYDKIADSDLLIIDENVMTSIDNEMLKSCDAIGLLSSKDSRSRLQALDNGFKDTISKPFTALEIIEKIKINIK